MNRKLIYILITIFVAVFAGTLTYFILTEKQTPTVQPIQNTNSVVPPVNQPAANVNTPAPVTTIEYTNAQYGFNFTLPVSWTGYSIVTDKWDGYTAGPNGDVAAETGPLISIRHPEWTAAVPRQDIPIMIFTLDQWNALQADKFHIGAAPIGPSELGRNAKYVFALPARYNFAYPAGYEEVDQIIQSNPLRAF